jgi:hypothetical protein
MRHKHADYIIAWAEGKAIECRARGSDEWVLVEDPLWAEDAEYRTRERKPDEIVSGVLELEPERCVFRPAKSWEYPNIRLLFDGETGALKTATVLTSAK